MEYLESIASRYEGEARVQRLLWIATQMTAAAAANCQQHHHHHHQKPSPETASGYHKEEPLQVAATAWNLLARHFQDSGNTHRYKEVFALMAAANSTIPNMQEHQQSTHGWPIMDVTWLSQQDARNRQARDVLQSRLSQAQAHLHKDAIRTAYLAIAEHELKISGGSGGSSGTINGGGGSGGGTALLSSNLDPPAEAFHMVLRAKDYCVNRTQTAAVSLQILEIALALKNYGSVREYVTKLEHTLDVSGGNATTNNSMNSAPAGGGGGGSSMGSMMMSGEIYHRVKVASALEALSQGDFNRAARVLVDLVMGRNTRCGTSMAGDGSPSSGNSSGSSNITSWPGVLCGEEIALYAAILALCCLSRSEIQQLAEHPEALELAPAMRECLWQFHRGNYHQACANLLPVTSSESSTMEWEAGTTAGINHVQLDVYLGPHLPQLQSLIIQKAILAYWQPYTMVDLPTMARELGSGLVPMGTEFLLQHMVQVLSQSHGSSAAAATSSSSGNSGSSSRSKRSQIAVAATTSSTKLLDTRIDLPALTLVREQVDTLQEQEILAEHKLQMLTTSILDDTYSMMIRLACIEHDLVVGGSDHTGGRPRSGGGSDMWRQRGSKGHRNHDAGVAAGAAAGGEIAMRSGCGSSSSNNNPMECVAGAGGEDEMISSDEEDVLEDDEEEHAMVDIADDMNPEDLY